MQEKSHGTPPIKNVKYIFENISKKFKKSFFFQHYVCYG